MITRPIRRPRIDMHMLNLYAFDAAADIRVVQLLAIHVKQIRVALLRFQARHRIRVSQLGYLLKGL